MHHRQLRGMLLRSPPWCSWLWFLLPGTDEMVEPGYDREMVGRHMYSTFIIALLNRLLQGISSCARFNSGSLQLLHWYLACINVRLYLT